MASTTSATATDGIFAEMGEINIGLTMMASTEDEQGFTDLAAELIALLSDLQEIEIEINEVVIGDYNLQEMLTESIGEKLSIMFFGADNGYMLLGSSEEMLKDGLGSGKSLADDETYRNTWKAFPSGSHPFLYLNLNKIADFIIDSMDVEMTDENLEIAKKLEKFTVIAMTVNKSSKYTQSTTLIIFIDTDN